MSEVSRRRFLAAAGIAGAATLASQAAAPGASPMPATTPAADSPKPDAPKGDVPLAPPDKQPPKLTLPEPPPKKLGWAIVGLGQLSLEEILPAFKLARLSAPTALVSGHPDKAKQVAEGYGIDPKSVYGYDTFDKIADNPAVDVVYVVLPNSMHAEYTVRGLKAGKHVLCEKPMAATSAECETMIAAAKEAKKKLMIAYRLRYEPFNLTAIDLCRKGTVGKLKAITASNCQDVKAPNIRLSKELAGGPVGDVGIYCLNAARYLTGEEPTEATAVAHQPTDDPRFREVPESVSFTVKFPSGVLASCECSFGTAQSRRYRVTGTTGLLDMDKAFGYRGQRLFVDKGDGYAELTIDPVNHFAAEMDHLSDCIRKDLPVRTPGEEGLADMRVIEAIYQSAASGKAVKLKG